MLYKSYSLQYASNYAPTENTSLLEEFLGGLGRRLGAVLVEEFLVLLASVMDRFDSRWHLDTAQFAQRVLNYNRLGSILLLAL
jgi:hypothetical protein